MLITPETEAQAADVSTRAGQGEVFDTEGRSIGFQPKLDLPGWLGGSGGDKTPAPDAGGGQSWWPSGPAPEAPDIWDWLL